MSSAAEQCLKNIATAARKTADLFRTLQDVLYAYCDLHIAKEHLYIQICKSMVVAALFGKSFRNNCFKNAPFPTWPAPWPPACGGGVGAAPRKNFTAFYSDSMGNQIQGETLRLMGSDSWARTHWLRLLGSESLTRTHWLVFIG